MGNEYNELRKITEQEADKYNGNAAVDIYVVGNRSAESVMEDVRIPYTVEFGYKDWGINGMDITMRDTINIEAEIIDDVSDQRSSITIQVNLAQAQIEWAPGGIIAPQRLNIYINEQGEVDYERTTILFSYIKP